MKKSSKPQQDFLSADEQGLFYAKVHRHVIKTFRDENVNRSAIMVYLDLARHCNVGNGALHHRDIAAVAENVGISERRVYSALTELEEVGLIDRKQLLIGGRLPHVGLSTARARLAAERDDENARGLRGAQGEYQRKAKRLEEAYGIDVSKLTPDDVRRLWADVRQSITEGE